MTRLLLDTTFLVDTDRAGAALDDVIDDDDDVAIAAITIAELLVGVGLGDSKHRGLRQQLVDDALAAIPILDYDTAVARSHADLLLVTRRQGRPRGAHDLIIAATARANQRVVVSADPAAFADLPEVTLRSHRTE